MSVMLQAFDRSYSPAPNFRFESIPVDVIMLGHLQYLEMSHNAVTMVSSKIGLMASLKILDLSNNQLSELPDSIGRLENLEMLLLSHNRFLQVR